MNKLVHVIAVLGGCVIARLDRAIFPKIIGTSPIMTITIMTFLSSIS